MRLLMVSLSLLISISAHANLLDQVRLEDVLRERATGVIRLLDPEAKVFVQIKFDGLSGDLPGGFSAKSNAVPENPGVDDIEKVEVTVYTKKDPVPEEVKKAVISALSLPSSKVKVDYKQWEFLKDVGNSSTEITVQNLQEVISTSVMQFLNRFGIYFGVATLLLLGLGFVQSKSRSKDVKEQTKELVSAVRAFGEGGGAARPASVEPAPQQQQQAMAPMGATTRSSAADSYLSNLSLESLKELFGDCYWTENDGYAHTLWRDLPVKMRESLLAEVDYMSDYVKYFFTQRPVDLGMHEHPYYLAPQSLHKMSQKDVLAQVSKKVALWMTLSPMRQQTLELGMMDRVKALQAVDMAKKMELEAKKSDPRVLPPVAEIGDLNEQDEMAIFENPESVPQALRPQVRTLVWLSQCDKEHIEKTLAQMDAKNLAQAWVGPDALLEKLASHMPAKKLTLLQEYRSKSRPSRRSTAFALLFRAGFETQQQLEGIDEKRRPKAA